MDGLEIRELTLYKDQRGWLGEIIRDDESGIKPVMSYLSMTKPGLVRGPHENAIIDTTNVPTLVTVPPGIVHAYKNIDSNDGLVINLPDRLYGGRGKTEPVDEVRYEDDLSSPFRIEE
jgi:dTDP-4-dehydrorhamnose 3,5-epimerase